MWGIRYFARAVEDYREFENVMNYIDQNPVKAGLVCAPTEWNACGAFHIVHDIEGLVDFNPQDRLRYVKLLV
ncbi:MAG: hypothetical protein FWD13_06885 [Treponema sp.]|nr:hypothetical protein [Treponema sp.]